MKLKTFAKLGCQFTAFVVLPLLSSAAAQQMQYPVCVAAAPDGALYVADRRLPGVWKIADGQAEVFFQAKKQFRTPLNAISTLALDERGRLLAGDSATRDVYRFEESGEPTPLTGGRIGIPLGIAVNKAGDIFVSDRELQRIWKLPAQGGPPAEFAPLPTPQRIYLDAEEHLWAVSSGQQPLVRLTPDGEVESVLQERVFENPHDVVVDEHGVAYVSDNYARAVWKVSPQGRAEKWISRQPLVGPVGLDWQDGKLLIADPQANAIFSADADGKLTTIFPIAGD